jgi:hypothetical protein
MSDDDTVAVEMIMPTCEKYQNMDPWWKPTGREGKKQAPQLNAEAEPFVPMQWAQAPLAGMESPSGDHMCWTEQTLEQEANLQEWSPTSAPGEWHSTSNSGEWRTTVMLRNMPNNYTRDMLLELADEMGFEGSYDFAYLPIDFSSQAGLGYAFINFASPEKAELCFEIFEGFSAWKVPSEKVCTVTWSSPYQGLESHIDRYRNSPVMHQSIIDEWKPVLFRNGARVPFPPPTKAIKTPKIRQHSPANGVQLQ